MLLNGCKNVKDLVKSTILVVRMGIVRVEVGKVFPVSVQMMHVPIGESVDVPKVLQVVYVKIQM